MNDPIDDTDRFVDELVERVIRRFDRPRVLPRATYRLQLERGRFGFREAAALVPYLRDLGISHVYASPFLTARSGSAHGYDVVDHTRIDPALGGNEEFAHLVAALHEHEMGLVMDIVPNHMGIVGENAHWNDVLENGACSPSAAWFDIDWDPINPLLKNRLLLPVLGDQYGRVLEAGDLRVEYDEGAFFVRYFDNRFPVDPRTYEQILGRRLDAFRERLPGDDPSRLELESILTAIEYLPNYSETDPERIVERNREKEVVKNRLRRLVDAFPAVAEFIRENLTELNGDPDQPDSFDELDRFLSAQVYRLAHWKSAGDEINYRRFFDINELAAICMEEPAVFEQTHRLVFELLARGDVDGLRIDHIDGLFDPRDYVWRLHWSYLRALGEREWAAMRNGGDDSQPGSISKPAVLGTQHSVLSTRSTTANGDAPLPDDFLPRLWGRLRGPDLSAAEAAGWHHDWATHLHEDPRGRIDLSRVDFAGGRLPLYILVEKILEADEPVPTWPVAGTTGYEFLDACARLFVDPGGFRDVERKYRTFAEYRDDFPEIAYDCKKLILRVAMSGELQMLGYRLNRLSEQQRRARDYTLNNLTAALREILACFPVYRTYLAPDRIVDRDRRFLDHAVGRAKRRNPAMEAQLFDFVRDTLLFEQPPEPDRHLRIVRRFFVGRFQQTSSAVMAKSVEDTAFYRYFPLASLNEVGGAPEQPRDALERFHRANEERLRLRPEALLASTSHDAKRSEDVRARIHVLSEISREWGKTVTRWARLNRKFIADVDGEPAPSRNDEYLFYQTLVGIMPPAGIEGFDHARLIERLQGYMEKATHEAKQRTSWISPVPRYDDAVRQFVAAALRDEPRNRFLADVREFCAAIDGPARYTALSQAFLKLTSPGVPDTYQGQELWDDSLVDPDNRRPIDFDRRAWLLGELRAAGKSDDEWPGFVSELARNPQDDRLKLLATWRLLQFRAAHPEAFTAGTYSPLRAAGARHEHVCAFIWRWNAGDGQRLAIAIAPRLLFALCKGANGDDAPRPPLGRDVWGNTSLAFDDPLSMPLVDLFTRAPHEATDGALDLAALLGDFPVAFLTNAEGNTH
ncbi:MAG: malto-oligosyltrehalose synthase [Planctomycetaceae bacterium]